MHIHGLNCVNVKTHATFNSDALGCPIQEGMEDSNKTDETQPMLVQVTLCLMYERNTTHISSTTFTYSTLSFGGTKRKLIVCEYRHTL